MIEHPDRFISVAEPPFPAYTFGGENLADDDRVEIRLEDHYWNDSDAAVVFERRDRATGERRYVYHGNDGTSFPWNDTAQLDYLQADVREAVIQTILEVARRFPVIRFDAAMVLAKTHIERLWWPEPGHGGAIPSRSEHAMSRADFERLMPNEFWREVVDRVAAEAPDTLLLAEAFWLLEGYFVRTLGMHRVYNSAFMHMLRDEDNAGYRKVIRDTLEFDPEILKRYVNFMTNPDEETAIEQFGTGDKYFGIATLLATMPGLPMIGHGQIEGFAEKYGMEFRRAQRRRGGRTRGSSPGSSTRSCRSSTSGGGTPARPTSGSTTSTADGGAVLDDVFAYSNGRGPDRSLVVYHNRFASVAGWIRDVRAVRGQGRRRLEVDAAARRSPRRWRCPADDDAFVALPRGAVRARVPATRPASSSSAGCSSSWMPTAAWCSAGSGRCGRRPRRRGRSWRRSSAGRGVRSLDDELADLRLRAASTTAVAGPRSQRISSPPRSRDGERSDGARSAPPTKSASRRRSPRALTGRRGAAPPPGEIDPAVRTAALLRPIDRSAFDRASPGEGSPRRRPRCLGGVPDPARTRPRPCRRRSETRRPTSRSAWLEDVTTSEAFLGVHDAGRRVESALDGDRCRRRSLDRRGRARSGATAAPATPRQPAIAPSLPTRRASKPAHPIAARSAVLAALPRRTAHDAAARRRGCLVAEDEPPEERDRRRAVRR